MLFPLGHIAATPGALHALGVDSAPGLLCACLPLLRRHVTLDPGDLCAEDQQANRDAIEHGNRILSAYTLPDETRIWIITEADRSVTTILLPEEY